MFEKFEKQKIIESKEVESKELTPETEKHLSDFKEFIGKHQKEIESELARGKLWEFLYDNFCIRDIDNLKYREDRDPESVQLLQSEYLESLKEFENELEKETSRRLRFKFRNSEIIQKDDYWLGVGTNMSKKSKFDGRFYLNLKPEKTIEFFKNLISKADSQGLVLATKIPRLASEMELNRFDKMTIYFYLDDQEKILDLINQLYDESTFDKTGIPRFASEVKNKEGKIMVGIGFGEEPVFPRESFSSIRAKILEDVYSEFKNSGKPISEFDFKSAFIEVCKKYRVDPKNPAYNLKENPNWFKEESQEKEQVNITQEKEQENIVRKYLKEWNDYQILNEEYQNTLRKLDKFREMGFSEDDQVIINLKSELKGFSELMNSSLKEMESLFNQLSYETKEKYLKPKEPETKVEEFKSSEKETEKKLPDDEKEKLENHISYEILRERKNFERLYEEYDTIERKIKKARELGLSENDSYIKELNKKLAFIFDQMKGSEIYMKKLLNQLSSEAQEKVRKEIRERKIAKEYLRNHRELGSLYGEYNSLATYINELLKSGESENDPYIKNLRNELKNIASRIESLENENQKFSSQLSYEAKELYLKPSNAKILIEELGPSEKEIEKEVEKEVEKRIKQEKPQSTQEKSPAPQEKLDDSLKEKMIANAKDFRDLIVNVLPRIGDIKGSDDYVYTPQKLIEIINDVRAGRKDINYVTRTHGLREKVKELLEKQSR